MGGSTPKAPAPPPPMPTTTDQEAEDARNRERRRALAANSRASTVLTGGIGLTADAPVKTQGLLGGSQAGL